MLHVVVFSFVAPVIGRVVGRVVGHVAGHVVGHVVVVVVVGHVVVVAVVAAAAVVGIAPTSTSLPTTILADPIAAAHGKCCCSIRGHQGKRICSGLQNGLVCFKFSSMDVSDQR